MRRVTDIAGVSITLEVGSETALFILVHQDGTVNRLGTGSVDNSEKALHIGRTSPSLLPAVASPLTDDMLRFMGTDARSEASVWCDRLDFEIGFCRSVSCTKHLSRVRLHEMRQAVKLQEHQAPAP